MKFSKICLIGLTIAACSFPLVGCSKGGDSSGIDAPLMKDAPPPPAQSHMKPTVKPSTGGGPGGAAATP